MRPEERLRHGLAPPPELAPPVHGRRDYSRLPAVATEGITELAMGVLPVALRLREACARKTSVAITREEVRRVAALARLRLEPAEEERCVVCPSFWRRPRLESAGRSAPW